MTIVSSITRTFSTVSLVVTSSQQAFSYDALGRLTNGPSGNETYGDSNHTHATTALSTVPNQYASYDATGNMTCRNTDTTTSHTCAGASPTGAQLSYDNEGQLVSWSSPSGGSTSSSDQFLYDAEGNRVLQHASSTTGGTTTVSDTITFDSYTETTITNGTTSTTKYYSAGGKTVAMAQGANWYGLVTDLLGNVTLAVNAQGHVVSAQLFTPYGSTSYSNGTMPTTYNYTGQRLDSVTGLLYYNARYYDPVSGRFISADDVQGNNVGMDPYGYVGGNPETWTDPSGYRPTDDDPEDNDETPYCCEPDYMPQQTYDINQREMGTTEATDMSEQRQLVDDDEHEYEAQQEQINTARADAVESAAQQKFVDGERYNDPYYQNVAAEEKAPQQEQPTEPQEQPTEPQEQPSEPQTEAQPRMNPNNIGVVQDTVSNRGNGYTVEGNIEGLQNGTINPDEMGDPIRVFQKTPEMDTWGSLSKNGYTGDPKNLINDAWYTLDNRRLYAFQQAGVESIGVEIVDDMNVLKSQRWKFSTTTWGLDPFLVK